MNTDRVRVSKTFTFDMGHALIGYDGPCKDIHGHTYQLTVTIIGSPLQEPGAAKDGMVVDFSLIKEVVQQKVIGPFDHALVLNAALPESIKDNLRTATTKLVFVPFQPSCENLILLFKRELLPVFTERGWDLVAMKLYETPTSYAEWFAADNGR